MSTFLEHIIASGVQVVEPAAKRHGPNVASPRLVPGLEAADLEIERGVENATQPFPPSSPTPASPGAIQAAAVRSRPGVSNQFADGNVQREGSRSPTLTSGAAEPSSASSAPQASDSEVAPSSALFPSRPVPEQPSPKPSLRTVEIRSVDTLPPLETSRMSGRQRPASQPSLAGAQVHPIAPASSSSTPISRNMPTAEPRTASVPKARVRRDTIRTNSISCRRRRSPLGHNLIAAPPAPRSDPATATTSPDPSHCPHLNLGRRRPCPAFPRRRAVWSSSISKSA